MAKKKKEPAGKSLKQRFDEAYVGMKKERMAAKGKECSCGGKGCKKCGKGCDCGT